MKQKKTRFEAEWVVRQHRDACGEWDPDRDEYEISYHSTRAEAEKAAIENALISGIEWIAVTEQEWKVTPQNFCEWIDVRRWSGDYNGLTLDSVTVYDEVDA